MPLRTEQSTADILEFDARQPQEPTPQLRKLSEVNGSYKCRLNSSHTQSTKDLVLCPLPPPPFILSLRCTLNVRLSHPLFRFIHTSGRQPTCSVCPPCPSILSVLVALSRLVSIVCLLCLPTQIARSLCLSSPVVQLTPLVCQLARLRHSSILFCWPSPMSMWRRALKSFNAVLGEGVQLLNRNVRLV